MCIIQTYSGIDFNIVDINPALFKLEDIAHALSHINRFTGHTDYAYSVAQHSVLCAHLVPDEFKLEALFHDAHEAYVGDVSTPLKHLLPDYQEIEDRIEHELRKVLNLPACKSFAVSTADRVMLATERRDLMSRTNQTPWAMIMGITPMDKTILPWQAQHAKAEFIYLAKQLLRKNGVTQLCM